MRACGVPSPTILYSCNTSAFNSLVMYSYAFGSFRINAFRLNESKPYIITLNGNSFLGNGFMLFSSVLRIPVNKPNQTFRSLLKKKFNFRSCEGVIMDESYLRSSVQHLILTKSDFVNSKSFFDETRVARSTSKSLSGRIISTKSQVIAPKRSTIESLIVHSHGFYNKKNSFSERISQRKGIHLLIICAQYPWFDIITLNWW